MYSSNKFLEQLEKLPEDWHDSGPLDKNVLRILAKCCQEFGTITHSAETGAGKSTLFFSNISLHHTVFALDVGMSLTRVKESDLFRQQNVTFVEGPTQKTLPAYDFKNQLDVVLIDGPHGYPFPDLEYYYFYPHITERGLLIIDDINIPSIKRMVEIIRQDSMFDCVDIVGKTMFLRRTTAPLFNPLGDGWWDQGYNQPFLRKTKYLERVKKSIPKRLFNLIPESLRLFLQKHL